VQQPADVSRRYARTPVGGSSRALHLAIAAEVNRAGAQMLIDYGCGDGRLLPLVEASSRFAFDPAPEMVELVRRRHALECSGVFTCMSEIPSETFDVVVFSLVLPWLQSADEVHRTLADVTRISRSSGRVLVGTTHPCFRAERHSDFFTEFCTHPKKRFPYRIEATKFSVTMIDDGGEADALTFIDTHWSLGFTFDALRQAGLNVDRLVEVYEDGGGEADFPPFVLFVCTISGAKP
jgi:hypothetical protein